MTHKIRRTVLVAAGITLLAGTGAFAARQGLLPIGSDPVADPHQVTVEAVCGWDAAGTEPPTGASIRSVSGDLVLPVHVAVPYRVQLSAEQQLEVPAGSAPVLVATVGVEAKVMGYARPSFSPESGSLNPGEVLEHSDFEPFVACPGEPTTADGVHLPQGSYELHAAQALGWEADDRAAPFNTWARLGSVSITDHHRRGEAVLEAAPQPGTCGSSLDQLPLESTHLARFEPLEPVLAVGGETVRSTVHLRNNGPVSLQDAVQGGPALLVASEGVVVARSAPAIALPSGGLGAGQSVLFSAFQPLTDCRTGEPLAPGTYEYAVAQQAHSSEALQPLGSAVRGGALAVTDTPGAIRVSAPLPAAPVCGEPAGTPAFDGVQLTGTVTWAGLGTRDIASGTVLRDSPDGSPTVEIEATYAGPELEVRAGGHHLVLERDGVVVARSESVLENGATELWTAESTHLSVIHTWEDCEGLPVTPEGTYAVSGWVHQIFADEWGLPTHLLTTLAPTEVSFSQPLS